MQKFHVNDKTGETGKCSATFQCPFGDLETEHYYSMREAREAFEKKMIEEEAQKLARETARKTRRLTDPILDPSNKMTLPEKGGMYYLDYDYDSYLNCNEYGCDSICRCSRITDAQVTGWTGGPEGLATYVKDTLNLPKDEPLPKELVEKIKPFATNIADLVEVKIIVGYYGEEIGGIELPDKLHNILLDHYYKQEFSEGPGNILAYLRGKGYATEGEKPLEAIKGMLMAENNGSLNSRVANATRWKKQSVKIDNIKIPNESKMKAGVSDPRVPQTPFSKSRTNPQNITGVLYQKQDGSFELIDGYHRIGWMKNNGKKMGNFIVLASGDVPKKQASSYGSYRPRHLENDGWETV